MRFLAAANLRQIMRREERHVDAGEARAQLDDRIKQIFGGATFDMIPFVSGPFDVPPRGPLLAIVPSAVPGGGVLNTLQRRRCAMQTILPQRKAMHCTRGAVASVLASVLTVAGMTDVDAQESPMLSGAMGAHHVPLFPSASNPFRRQGFIRVINRSENEGTIRIDAFDDAGVQYGPVQLSIGARRARHFNSGDLEQGNRGKGLDGFTGPPDDGDWRLVLKSTLDLDVLGFMRTRDGFLTSLHALAPHTDSRHRVAIFNPGGNVNQVSLLRLINPGEEPVSVVIEGIDAHGESPGSTVRLSLAGGTSRTLTAQQLEEGTGEGLSGALGDGAGKWRLMVSSDRPIRVMSLLSSPTGHLTNLSTAPDVSESDDDGAMYGVPLFPSASRFVREGVQGFVRVINHSEATGEARIDAFDDSGGHYGPVTLQIAAGRTVHFNSGDLEEGNPDKGLSDGTGPPGEGDWRLTLSSSLDLEVLSYIRTSDGFLTSMHDLVPATDAHHRVAIFNPGSNRNQVSWLRLINPGSREANVTIKGVDDDANSPGSTVQISVPAGGSRTLTAHELESGEEEGLSGALGDGAGKWQLVLSSDSPVHLMNLLSSPAGHLTNLSAGTVETIEDPYEVQPYLILGEHRGAEAGWTMADVGDVDCDGTEDILLGSPLHLKFESERLSPSGRVYLISGADLRTADGADGKSDRTIDLRYIPGQEHSWTISGTYSYELGRQMTSIEDLDGDGCSELILGAPDIRTSYAERHGSVYVVSGSDLSRADQADGRADRQINIHFTARQPNSWKLEGEADGVGLGASIVAGDMNGDGHAEIVIAAPGAGSDGNGAVYILSADALRAVGRDRIVLPRSLAGRANVWKLNGATRERNTGKTLAMGDFDGDGSTDLLVHAELNEGSETDVLYIVAATDLVPADAADGNLDGQIDLANIAEQTNSWRLTTSLREKQDPGESILAAHDLDGDGIDEIALAPRPREDDAATLAFISLATLGSTTNDQSNTVRNVSLADLALAERRVTISGGSGSLTVWGGKDLNGDDIPEVFVGEPGYVNPSDCVDSSVPPNNGAIYILSGSRLRAADAADGTVDSTIDLANVSVLADSWKIIGEPGDRLGARGHYIADPDGDGAIDVGFGGNFVGQTFDRCRERKGEGGALLLSISHMNDFDAKDGVVDGEIYLDTVIERVECQEGEELPSLPKATRQFGDNIILIEMTGCIRSDKIEFVQVAKAVLANYEDTFDYLFLVSNLPSIDFNSRYQYYGAYYSVQNHARGSVEG